MRTIEITPKLTTFTKKLYEENLSSHVKNIHKKLKKGPPSKVSSNPVSNSVHNYICKFLDQHIDSILLYTPREMEKLIISFRKFYSQYEYIFYLDEGDKGNPMKKSTEFSKWIYKDVLNYDKFRKELGSTITEYLGVKTCPYCNALLTVTFEKKDKKHGKANLQLDHFFPKSKYPYFAISFFNLLPCCNNCNLAKGDHDYDLNKDFHLYTENTSSTFFKFLLDPLSKAKFTQTEQREDIKIEFRGISSNYDNYAEHHSNKFDIVGIYNTQKDIVEELYQKKLIYQDSYKDDLKKVLGPKWGNSAYIDRLILGNYSLEKDIHKRPLAKFTQDIAKEFKLNKDSDVK